MDPRTFDELADHARIAQEQLSTAQGGGYIAGPSHYNPGDHPVLPGFSAGPHGASLGHGSRNLGDWFTAENVRSLGDHVRFLEHVTERLAAQVAELAERLADTDPNNA